MFIISLWLFIYSLYCSAEIIIVMGLLNQIYFYIATCNYIYDTVVWSKLWNVCWVIEEH